MATDPLYKLSSPNIFLVRMCVFLILAAFVAFILYQQIAFAFKANPGLNGLIIAVLLFGIVLAFQRVIRLLPEVRWVNHLQLKGQTKHLASSAVAAPPALLLPMAKMIGDGSRTQMIPTVTMRVILDSIAMRLDESRDIARYLTGLLIFLGLLGTFWGLVDTVASIGNVIKSMQSGSDAGVMFDDLKQGLQAPLAGMSVSFTSSLFGLAGSLILGFLDLQASQAQNRFYNELEDYLATITATLSDSSEKSGNLPTELHKMLRDVLLQIEESNTRVSTHSLPQLAEGIHTIAHHMRQEQQLVRDWVNAQAEQQQGITRVLEKLVKELDRGSKTRS